MDTHTLSFVLGPLGPKFLACAHRVEKQGRLYGDCHRCTSPFASHFRLQVLPTVYRRLNIYTLSRSLLRQPARSLTSGQFSFYYAFLAFFLVVLALALFCSRFWLVWASVDFPASWLGDGGKRPPRGEMRRHYSEKQQQSSWFRSRAGIACRNISILPASNRRNTHLEAPEAKQDRQRPCHKRWLGEALSMGSQPDQVVVWMT